MRNMEFRAAEMEAVADLVPEAQKIVQMLKGRKTNTPRTPTSTSRRCPRKCWRSSKWKCRIRRRSRNFATISRSGGRCAGLCLLVELDALGRCARAEVRQDSSNSFSKCSFAEGRATPEDRTKILRKLAGIKEEPKKKPEKEKKRKGKKPATPEAKARHGKGSRRRHAAATGRQQNRRRKMSSRLLRPSARKRKRSTIRPQSQHAGAKKRAPAGSQRRERQNGRRKSRIAHAKINALRGCRAVANFGRALTRNLFCLARRIGGSRFREAGLE